MSDVPTPTPALPDGDRDPPGPTTANPGQRRPQPVITQTGRRVLDGFLVTVVAVAGAWLGLLLAGDVDARIGPLHAQLSVAPSLHGDTSVEIAPLGSLELDTHDGPLAVDIRVDRLDAVEALRIVANPAQLAGLGDEVAHDLHAAGVRLAVQVVLAAVGGALLLALITLRRWRRVLAAGGVAAALICASLGISWATCNPDAVTTPRYTGLLTAAPSLVGTAQSITSNFTKYANQLGRLVTNVSSLYDVTSQLRTYELPDDTIRVLHVSDVHLNPTAYSVMHSLVKHFRVDAVVDSGDLTDHGTAAESRQMALLSAGMGVPYVWVRGNHDSMATQAIMAAQRHIVVLDDEVKTVVGLRMAGVGDPRFTPDKDLRAKAGEKVLGQNTGSQLAAVIRAQPQPVDLAIVHDPLAAPALAGSTPLVLAGHTHKRTTERLGHGTRLMVEGSTGGAGLRALQAEEPTPIEATILYFDRTTHRLQAWDDVTLGGLGLASAEISRHLADEDEAKPQPTGSVPAAATATPGR